jgi:signal transduction histidine kinase
VLDFSRLETGCFEADPVTFDLHALIRDVAAELQARASDKGLTGSLDIDTSCPRHVIADATRLRQVLMGLIDNSLKYTSIGSVRLHASAKEEDGRLQLRFDIVDTGVGLSKAVKDRLFQRCIEINSNFRRGHRPRTSYRAQARQAHIGCKSVVGQGSLYWFTLPAQHPRPEPAVGQPQANPRR